MNQIVGIIEKKYCNKYDNNVLVIIGIPFILIQMNILHIEYFEASESM